MTGKELIYALSTLSNEDLSKDVFADVTNSNGYPDCIGKIYNTMMGNVGTLGKCIILNAEEVSK